MIPESPGALNAPDTEGKAHPAAHRMPQQPPGDWQVGGHQRVSLEGDPQVCARDGASRESAPGWYQGMLRCLITVVLRCLIEEGGAEMDLKDQGMKVTGRVISSHALGPGAHHMHLIAGASSTSQHIIHYTR